MFTPVNTSVYISNLQLRGKGVSDRADSVTKTSQVTAGELQARRGEC